jgi:preprotein translocase subunit SecB
MDNKTESGFRIISIILRNCSFNREPNVIFDIDKFDINANINVSVEIKENNINVILDFIYDQTIKGSKEKQISAFVSMVGLFVKTGDSEIKDLEKFGKENGAAMIYPYVREFLSNMAVRSGIGPIFLPPVCFKNFTNKKAQ